MKLAATNRHGLRRLIGLSVGVITAIGIGVGVGMTSVWAADNNTFPEVVSGGFAGPAWKLSQVSPSGELLQTYTTDRNNNDTQSGQFFHVLKNEQTSQVRNIKVRAYFTGPTPPGQVTVNIAQQGDTAQGGKACDFSSGNTDSFITMNVGADKNGNGGDEVYRGQAYQRNKNRITEEHWFWKYAAGVHTERDNLRHQVKNGVTFVEACTNLPDQTFGVFGHYEKCGTMNDNGTPNKAGDDYCNGADTAADGIGWDDIGKYNNSDPYQFSSYPDPGVQKKFEGDYTTSGPISSQQIGKNLWAVNINVNLSGATWNGNDNQVRFKIRVDGANSVGFQDLSNESNTIKEQSFGVTSRGSFNDTEWGIRAYVPFGMECKSPSNSIPNAEVSLYDVDVQEFGESFISVFRRDPLTNQVVRMDLDPVAPHANWQSGAGRIQATGGEGQTSTARFEMVKGYQYMMVVVNPNQRNSNPGLKSPLNNLLSLGIPGESIYGVYDCNYTLTPSVDPIAPTFSYDASFGVNGRIAVQGEDFESHEWQLTRIKYATGSPDIAAKINTQEPCVFRAGDCSVIDNGSVSAGFSGNFAANPYAYNENNVPLGTRVCFMMSVRKPSLRSAATEWSHSQMQCSQAVTTPKIQVHGDDLKTTGLINTSLGRVGGQTYGSWGEYGILSNANNIGMGSGSGLLGGVPNGTGLENWNQLTFASSLSQGGGAYGNFGGVTVPVPLVNRDGEIAGPGTLTGLGGLNKRQTYRINGTLTINENLDYGVFGASNNISDIPRIVLVADDIIIGPNVTRIDPWLVAIGGGGNPGRISTCSEVSGWSMQNAGLYGAQNGSGGICTRQLKFNGPVLANDIYLYRTFDTREGEPAEIFNLRADAYLSAMSGGGTSKPVATTDFVTELPPRF
ncbi:MAG: hypothetical protein V4678_03710 [Patescibacteria group bacterium]